MKKTKFYSYKIKNLAKGCRQCVKGEKLVLFVTGLCSKQCYFCPISDQKKNKDVIYANEWKLKDQNDTKSLIEEAKLTDAKGASLTGGDPFIKLNRSIRYIKLLKKKFGKKFHIHLYAPLKLITRSNLKAFYNAGLDEIRLHPDFNNKKDWHKIDLITNYDWDIGIEIPAIPGKKKEILNLIDYFHKHIKFLNINELEISDTNANKLLEKGFRTKDNISYAIKGSQQLAFELMKYCEKNTKLNVHYCTCTLKDKVQLANRIKKRAKNVKKDYDIVTDSGTLIRGAIYLPKLKPGIGYRKKLEKIINKKDKTKPILNKLNKIKTKLQKDYQIPNTLITIDNQKLRILIAPWIVKELKIKNSAIVEEYPTWDQMELEVEFT